MKVYVASAYSGDTEENVRIAVRAGEELTKKGHVPFIPHLFHYWDLLYPHPYDFWMSQCLEHLESCDAVLRLNNVSPGADQEVLYAMNILNIPVYYSIDDIESVYEGMN